MVLVGEYDAVGHHTPTELQRLITLGWVLQTDQELVTVPSRDWVHSERAT